ncbi:hypothetical protein C2845_PM09G19930 [Panicum miliaceum]|uniref:Response regulatory domain-containing protein n=1 Tax=Panicum miliaceum TaxID=4540 RepID=A0A3L6RYJ8_PANMI|nr:hypothetical protein C2845_PM09G19930 [Panicum miliaceum]
METMMKGIKHGACDYLVKPARMEQLRNIWTHVVKKNRSDPRNNISDGAVPKKILEVMNVDGLSRDNVASHLQKYRIYLKKLSQRTLSHSNPFIDEPQAWLSDQRSSHMNAPESSQHHLELVQPSPSSIGASNSSNARMSYPSTFGTHNIQQDLVQVGNGVNLPKDASSVGPSNQVDREPHQFSGLHNPINSWGVSVPSRFPDIGHSAGMPISSSQENHVRINQFSRSVASSGYVPTFGSQYQNQMSGLLGRTTPTLGFSEQVAPFNLGSSVTLIGSSALGSSSSVGPALADLQIGNSVTPAQMPSGGAATGNLPGGGTGDQQAVGDRVNNSNVLPPRTGEVQDGAIDDVSVFFADWVNQM